MKFYRLNQQIAAPSLRVLDEGNKQIGVLSRTEALAKATELGLDLVEIAPTANPPVCKIIDYKKFRYLEEKKKRESKKKAKASGTKELWLGPFMSENDLQVRIERGKEFLKDGLRLRLAVKFAGRQITHPEFGWNVLRRFVHDLEEYGRVEREPKFEGKILATILTPGKTPRHSPKANFEGFTPRVHPEGQEGKNEQTEAKNEEGSGKAVQTNQNR